MKYEISDKVKNNILGLLERTDIKGNEAPAVGAAQVIMIMG